MASYSMELWEMVDNPLTPIFNFDYDFYCDDLEVKKKFEEKFIDHYWLHEIGCETPARWNQMLKSRLNLIMPYYRQLYQTELASQNINFLLNKDLRETFIREIDTENQLSGTNTTNQNSSGTNSFSQTGSTNSTNSMSQSATSSSTNSTEQNGTTTNTHKESAINDGVAMATLSDGYLTGTSSDTGTSTNDSTSSSTSENESTASSSSTDDNETSGTSNSTDSVETTGTTSQTGNEKMVEKTDLLSQGNIGVTSSAELLQKWREVLINIDEMIIKDCRDLFMQVY